MNEASPQILNKYTMVELVGDDPLLIQQFEVDFLKQAQESMPLLVTSFQQQDYSGLVEHAHYLKTSARAIGAEVVSHLLQSLEHSAQNEDLAECKQLIIRTNSALKQLHGVIQNEE